jgi:hypothetical protein
MKVRLLLRQEREYLKNLKKYEEFLNESSKYLINVEYRVSKTWFNNPLEVLKTNLHFNTLLDSYEIKSTSYESKDFVADVKMISKGDKNTLRKYLDGHSTSSETYTIK